jgi:hypothetical protein
MRVKRAFRSLAQAENSGFGDDNDRISPCPPNSVVPSSRNDPIAIGWWRGPSNSRFRRKQTNNQRDRQ